MLREIFGKLFWMCVQGLTKCQSSIPFKPYSIECSLTLQLPSDSCSHFAICGKIGVGEVGAWIL